MSSILSKGLDNLLEQDKKVELKLMYNLLGKVTGGHAELKGKMCDYVKNRGRVIVVNPEKDKTMYVFKKSYLFCLHFFSCLFIFSLIDQGIH